MRHSRSFKTSPNHGRNHGRRPYAGANAVSSGGPCGVRATARPPCGSNCSTHPWSPKPHGHKCPPTKACPVCPPHKACPPTKSCPVCPPQKACPPEKVCPPKKACPPEKACPPQRPCPPVARTPQRPCPEYECEDACETLHGYDTPAYWMCVRRSCDPWTGQTIPPVAQRPRPIPTMTATFRPNAPDPECIFECRERYDAGEITYEVFKQCLVDCCLAEKIADGYSVDLARRECEPQTPAKPTPDPFCEQRCRGRYGVNTQGYHDCVKRECTLAAFHTASPSNPPYVP